MEWAVFSVKGETKKLTVQFNPETYTITRSNKITALAQNGTPPLYEYLGRNASTLSMELLFDSFVYGKVKQEDVRERYALLRTAFIQVNSELHAPPVISFSWSTVSFEGVLTELSERFTMFAESGTPVRSVVTVSIQGNTKEEFAEIPMHSPDRTKLHTVRQGETIWEIAGREYGDVGQWREIARANGIENPRKLEAASNLRIPALPRR